MTISITRHRLLAASLVAVPSLAFGRIGTGDIESRLASIERKNGGRLGVAVLDAAGGRRFGVRMDERFPLCSTFKVLAAALVLKRVDDVEESLDRRVRFSKDELVAYSPMTKLHAGKQGMTMAEICHAAITLSDNTAGNLMLASFGGPAGLTAFARTLGDTVTRLDRTETALNEARPGDPRDTTSPAAMLDDLQKLLLGDALSAESRKQLIAWMVANTTGGHRLRAGLPSDWRVGDKTGTSGNGIANDIGIAWPPDRKPVLITAYYDAPTADASQRNSAIADVARLAASGLGFRSRTEHG